MRLRPSHFLFFHVYRARVGYEHQISFSAHTYTEWSDSQWSVPKNLSPGYCMWKMYFYTFSSCLHKLPLGSIFSPFVQKHTGRWTGDTKLREWVGGQVCECLSVQCPTTNWQAIRGEYSCLVPSVPVSLWIEYNPDQDKVSY